MKAHSARPAFRFRLDLRSGVPAYRQVIDQVLGGIASGSLGAGDQLPTVRQLAVDLSINPNTVIRAYREMEIRGVLDTHQGSGTYVSDRKVKPDEFEQRRRLEQLVQDFVARAGAAGFSVRDLAGALNEILSEPDRNNKRR